jgi:hypothetical protein
VPGVSGTMWGMNLPLLLTAYQVNANPGLHQAVARLVASAAILFICWAVVLCGSMLLISRISGWSLLARRFRASDPWNGESWSWQSARFRGWCGYNNCLRVGANQQSLSLAVNKPFGMFHSPLLIPWHEIEVEMGKAFFGMFDMAQFRIGTDERVTVRIYGKLIGRIRQAAGAGWPLYRIDQVESQTRG